MSEYSGCTDFEPMMKSYKEGGFVSGTLPAPKKEFKYTCDEGNYTSKSLIGLTWAIFTHRMWHLFTHGKWMD